MGKIIMNERQIVDLTALKLYNNRIQNQLNEIKDRINMIEKHMGLSKEDEVVMVVNDDTSEFKIMLKGEYYNE